MVEIIQLLGRNRLMALPTQAGFDTKIAPKINQYLAIDPTNARENARVGRAM